MSYEFHVTRADHWASNEGQEILAEEWLALIKADPELVLVPENGKYFVVWRGTTKYSETWFNWFSGNIATENPDKATFRKMLEIAARLNAHIQGDEGELYDKAAVEAFDDSYLEGSSSTSTPLTASPNKRTAVFRKLFGKN
jgi:hypothetical protein